MLLIGELKSLHALYSIFFKGIFKTLNEEVIALINMLTVILIKREH